MILIFKIFRYDPGKNDEPHYQNYEIEAEPEERILDCLNRIRAKKDPTLSFRMSCGHGVCGSDGMRINGLTSLACQKLVKDFKDNEEVLIEPLQVFRVIKDLVVDMEPFFERYNSIRPYLITKTGCVLNNVAYSKNCHNGSFEIMRCPSKKAPCGSMPCWFIYTPHHLYSILYIKVTIRGTLPKNS
jgi:succinate dehydrogenase/fumarate reductase iron-sulfur protein